MGSRLSDAPWWMWSLVYTLAFAAVRVGIAIVDAIVDDAPGLIPRIAIAVTGSVVAGAIVGPFMAGVNRRARRAIGPLPPGAARRVARATMRGPVPDDAQVRAAARRLAQFRRTENLRGRGPMTVLFGLTVVGCLLAAVTFSPMWLLAALPVMALSGYSFWLPEHLQGRIDRLHPAHVEQRTPGRQ